MSVELAILVLEAVAVYLLVLWTHSLRHRVGLAPFYALLGGITAIMSWVTDAGVQVDFAGISFWVGSTVFYTSLLLGAFVVYVFDGPRTARIVIATVAGVSILMPVVAAILHLQADLVEVVPMPNLRINVASVCATIADLVFLAVAWEFLGASFLKLRLLGRAFLTLLGVMWLDVILFSTGAFAGTPGYFSIMKGTLVSRLVISVFATPFLYLYLRWQSQKTDGVIEARPVFSLLREIEGVRGDLRSAQEELELRRRAEEELRKNQAMLKTTLDSLADRVVMVNQAGKIVLVNRAWQNFIRSVGEDDALGQDYFGLVERMSRELGKDSIHEFLQGARAVLSGQSACYEQSYVFGPSQNVRFIVRVVPLMMEDSRWIVVSHTDQTAEDLANRRQTLLNAIFRRLNERGEQKKMLQDTIQAIQDHTGVDAIGIRLQDGPDYPYVVYKGFSDEFVEKEQFLCSYDKLGNLILDEKNQPVLQCMCGCVICGGGQACGDCFSDGGSFWTNRMSELVGSFELQKDKRSFRTSCRDTGYESVAMIPLRSGDELVGLLQLNDHRKDQFSEERIRFFEELGTAIGVEVQQAQTEEALRKSGQELHHVISAIQDGLWDWDIVKDQVTCSPQWYQMLGYEPDEFPTDWAKFESLVCPEDLPLVEEAVRAYFCNESDLYSVEFRIRRKSGEYAWVWARGSLIRRTEEGDPSRMIGIHMDVTEAHQIREELQQSETRYRQIFDSMQSGFALHEVICDDAGKPCDYRFLEVNAAFERLTGLSADMLIGKTVKDALPATEDSWIETYGRVALTGELINIEEFSAELGRSYSVSAYSPAAGQFATVFHDITEQKLAEQSMARARDAAEESSRAKTQFLANMSHELRTPLNAIIGLSELLSDSALDEEQADYVKTIGASGEALLSIVAELLDLSKIEMGKVNIVRREFDVRQIVDNSLALLSTFADQKSIQLSCGVDLDVPMTINNDADRLQQVLINLLNNSLKFTQDGGFVRLGVRVGVLPGGGRSLEFVVEDNGQGMDEETMARIFEPFQQGDLSATREHGGVGLGLAISRNLVEMMGGEISVESQPGQGSTFRFSVEAPA